MRRLTLEPLTPGKRPPLGDRRARVRAAVDDREEVRRSLDRELARLETLQAALYAEGTRSLLIVLQGRDASGKDGVVQHVAGAFNPQGVVITSFKRPNDVEVQHDYLWRVHRRVPGAGLIGVFNRSHYEDVLVTRVHRTITHKACERRFREINDFERMLTGNGVTILKFFLHVSRAEQEKRLDDRIADPRKNWKYDAGDLAERARWGAYTLAYRDVLARCGTAWAPWFVVPADDKGVRNLLIARAVAETLAAMAPKYPRAAAAVLKAARALQR